MIGIILLHNTLSCLPWDCDALPLLGSVLDAIECDDGMTLTMIIIMMIVMMIMMLLASASDLEDVVEHGRGVTVVGLCLAYDWSILSILSSDWSSQVT